MKIANYNVTHSLMRDGYIMRKEKIKLTNGNQLNVYTEFLKNKKATKLQYLINSAGEWVKSKLRYFSDNKVYKVMKSERNLV